jgi:hypothetical protein
MDLPYRPDDLGVKVLPNNIEPGKEYYYVYYEPQFIKFTATNKNNSRANYIDISTDNNLYPLLAFHKTGPNHAELYKVIPAERMLITNISRKHGLPNVIEGKLANYVGTGGRRSAAHSRRKRGTRRSKK